MKQISYFSFFQMLLFVSCTAKAPLSGIIKLPSDGNWASMVYLVQPRTFDEVAASFSGQVLDSAAILTDGSFAFKKMPEAIEPVLLELVIQRKGERFFNKLENEELTTANYFPFVWKNGDRLEVTASADQFQRSFSIKNPSPENAALLHLRDVRLKAFQQLQQKSGTQGHDESLLLEEEAARLRFQQASMDFAKETEHLLPALVAIRWVSPANDYERVPEFLVSQCEKWQNKNTGHPWVAQLCQKSNREQLPVLKGDQMPDAMLPMLSGGESALYQLLGERLTILDLWASWCAPCRRENRDFLAPLWDRYHEQGLQIIGYALEGSEAAWKNAIEKDGANRWLHASPLQGDDAPLLKTLRIQTIPSNFLLDAQGKVLAKNLHGEELVKFVEEYLGR